MVIPYNYSSPTSSFEDTVLATPGRRRPSLTVPFIAYRFGSVTSVRTHRNRYHCVIVSAGKPRTDARRQARDEKGDRERRRLFLYIRSAIFRSAAHDETRRRHLC
jgi:hypothetical protein